MRLSGIFIALCMLIIAGSAGAIVYLYLELGLPQAAAAAAATLIVLILCSLISGRIGFRSAVDRQLTDLSRGSADVARQVAEMGRRLAALEGKVDTALDQTRALTDPLTAEIGELGTLVKRLAETVAIQQTGLDALQRNVTSAGDTFAAMATAQPYTDVPQSPDRAMSSLPQPSAAQEPASRSVETVLTVIRNAIDTNQIDLYLQPIVSLPQRKVRHYESMSQLRDEKGARRLRRCEGRPEPQRFAKMPACELERRFEDRIACRPDSGLCETALRLGIEQRPQRAELANECACQLHSGVTAMT